ncbi:hypothetical protein KKG83_06380 [Candidatus Micrarchaeota archaeon]|nr:hypothetical protein [Candidatus Micrarchaeota archaeon]MBU2477069.1 hypothetical protein [Candidatus Micrarchaeota archaeon]
MAKEQETRISHTLVATTTNQFLNGKLGLFSRRGSRIVYMAATMQGEYETYVGLPKGGPTKYNIIALIGREIARKINIDPKNNKKEYDAIKGQIRGKVGEYLKNNEKAKAKLEEMMRKRKFRAAEWIGRRPKVGKALGATGKWIRIKRNL